MSNHIYTGECPHCQKSFTKITKRKYIHKFCSKSCSASFNNLRRTPQSIEKQKNTLFKTLAKIKKIDHRRDCIKCNKSFLIKYKSSTKKICNACKNNTQLKIKTGNAQNIKHPHTKVKPCTQCGKYTTNYHGKYCDSCSPNISHYRSKAAFVFNIYEYPDIFDLTLIDEHGWYSPNGYKRRNKKPNLAGVSRDHLYSVAEGFRNNINPKLLGHPANCDLILHNGPNGNSSKRDKCSITIEELKQRIKDW